MVGWGRMDTLYIDVNGILWGDPSIYHSLPWIVLPAYPVLPYPTPNYAVIYCHPTRAYLVLHWILLPSYPVLPKHFILSV